nr:hypothetical protein [Stenotrophomonas rhizophila]
MPSRTPVTLSAAAGGAGDAIATTDAAAKSKPYMSHSDSMVPSCYLARGCATWIEPRTSWIVGCNLKICSGTWPIAPARILAPGRAQIRTSFMAVQRHVHQGVRPFSMDIEMVRKIPAFLAGFLAFSANAETAQRSTSSAAVFKADSANVQGSLVRYLEMFDSSCLIVQIISRGNWEVVREKRICSVGKSRLDDFAGVDFGSFVHVHFQSIAFKPDHLQLKISFTPNRPFMSVERVRTCTISIRNESIGNLMC